MPIQLETCFTATSKPWHECSFASLAKITACVVGLLAIFIGLFAILGDKKLVLNGLGVIGSTGGGIILGTGVMLTLVGILSCKKKPQAIEPEKRFPMRLRTIPIKVMFTADPSDGMEFEVNPTRPLRELKLEIARRRGIPVTKQWTFRINGISHLFGSRDTLEKREITAPTHFVLQYYPEKWQLPVQISVQINDQLHECTMDKNSALHLLTTQIYDLFDLLPEKYTLIDPETNQKIQNFFGEKTTFKLKVVFN